MQILRFELGAVTYDNVVPIGLVIAGRPYSTAPGRQNARSHRCDVIDSTVRHRAIPQRMEAFHIKVGTYTGEFQGRPQKRFLYAFASWTEVSYRA